MTETPSTTVADETADLEQLIDLQQELYFGFSRAIGTPLQQPIRWLRTSLASVGFHVVEIRLSDQLRKTPVAPSAQGDRESSLYYTTYARAGQVLRTFTQRNDVLALLAVEELEQTRRRAREEALATRKRGVAYVFRSLMHPHEVRTLRSLYRNQFFLISVFSPEENRREHLAGRLSAIEGGRPLDQVSKASHLIHSEKGLSGLGQGQTTLEEFETKSSRVDIPRTFQLADLFITLPTARAEIDRFVHLLFSNQFIVPTVDELSMAAAYAAAISSGNLARQVGAAICTPEGDVIAVGTNDVPRPRGGVYRSGLDEENHADISDSVPRDTSDEIRRSIIVDFLMKLLSDRGWMQNLANGSAHDAPIRQQLQAVQTFLGSADLSESDFQSMADDIIRSPLISEAQLFDVVEYSRTLHAEMHAITTAARLGTSIKGAVLYCTTFPCHECARLILGSGIEAVLFVEPYTKSRVQELYKTEISLAESRNTARANTIQFRPFIGVSPRRHPELFSWIDRKEDDRRPLSERTLTGEKARWDPHTSQLRWTILPPDAFASQRRLNDVRVYEQTMLQTLKETLSEAETVIKPYVENPLDDIEDIE